MNETTTCPPCHWIVEPPNGSPTVGAQCKKCGSYKTFRVWDPAFDKLKVTVDDKFYLRPEDR